MLCDQKMQDRYEIHLILLNQHFPSSRVDVGEVQKSVQDGYDVVRAVMGSSVSD